MQLWTSPRLKNTFASKWNITSAKKTCKETSSSEEKWTAKGISPSASLLASTEYRLSRKISVYSSRSVDADDSWLNRCYFMDGCCSQSMNQSINRYSLDWSFPQAVKESSLLEIKDMLKIRTRDRPTHWPLPDVPNGMPASVPQQTSPASASSQDPSPNPPSSGGGAPVVVNGA